MPKVVAILPICPDCGSELQVLEELLHPFCPKCNCLKPQILVMRLRIHGKEAIALVPENLVHWRE